MMDKLTDDEKFLLLGKVTGSLTPNEESALEQLFQKNPNALSAYEELTNELPAEDGSNGFSRRKTKNTWRDLPAEFRNQQETNRQGSIPIYKRKWIAAAIIAGLIAGGGWLWNELSTSHPAAPQVIAEKKPAIELKLANGRTIDLSVQKGSIDGGVARFNNADKTLSYSSADEKAVSGTNTLIVPIGMDYKINLSDGSEIWLNAATRLDFPLNFSDSIREIRVNGEAYIKVAKNAAQPFVVHLPNSSVRVLGTEFNVNSYDSGVVKVALVEGAVAMQSAAGTAKVTPGKQAIYRRGKDVEQETFDEKYVLSWRKGLFYFNDANLSEISKITPRWYGVHVVIDNPTLDTRTFTGVINRNRPIAVFLDDLQTISGIESYFDKERRLHFK